MIPTDKYARVLDELFQFTDDGQPTQNVYLFGRLNEVEKFCFQMSVED